MGRWRLGGVRRGGWRLERGESGWGKRCTYIMSQAVVTQTSLYTRHTQNCSISVH